MILSIGRAVTLSALLICIQSASPQAQLKAFDIVVSLIGVLLFIVCLVIYLRTKPKVKYVQFESFEIDQKKKSTVFSTEVKLSHPSEDSESHKTITENKEIPPNNSTSLERRRRKRKVDRLQALSKKGSETDFQPDMAEQVREDCIEVE